MSYRIKAAQEGQSTPYYLVFEDQVRWTKIDSIGTKFDDFQAYDWITAQGGPALPDTGSAGAWSFELEDVPA